MSPNVRENRSPEYTSMRTKILQSIESLSELAAILKTLRNLDSVPMEDKVDLMLLVFTTESKTQKYDLLTYFWNFMKDLYNSNDKLVLRLIPAIAIDRKAEITEKHAILFKEIITRLYLLMVLKKDTSTENIEIMCRNVLILSKYFMRHSNYTEFFKLARDSFFNPKHSYQILVFVNQSSPANDVFLGNYIARVWEFKDCKEADLSAKGMSSSELLERLFQIFVFFVNYEGRDGKSAYVMTDKLISVLLNLQLTTDNKDTSNAIKCLYSIVQFMKDDNQDVAPKLFFHYMARVCEKATLNSNPCASDTLATLSLVLERHPFFADETRLRGLSLDSVKYLLQTVKLTVSLNVEPEKFICEVKDCAKNTKKHTITSWTRFAQKVFVAYVSQLSDSQPIDEEVLETVTQLVIFHFHLLERLPCSSRVASEHNDIHRLYKAFANRSKVNPPAGVLKIFETVLKYVLQRSLSALQTHLANLLIKYYTKANDTGNCDRVEWINLLCKYGDKAQTQAFETNCYNWVVNRQKLTVEELTPILKTMKETATSYNTELIPKTIHYKEVFLRMLEYVASLNLKPFGIVQESLVQFILDDWTEECSEDVVNVLFYATEKQIVNYKEAVRRNRSFFDKKGSCDSSIIPLAVLYSLEYQIYNAELRQELKSVNMDAIQNREAKLSSLSIRRENEQMENLTTSLAYLRKISSAKKLKDPREIRQIIGTIKRNIRFFQLAGKEFEEVASCKLLYDLSGESNDTEGSLLAMANLVNHVHFIIKDERCCKEFSGLIRIINGEGTDLLAENLRALQQLKEHLRNLVVYGIGNIIRFNADVGRLEKSYNYLTTLKAKIDEIGAGKDEPTVIELQYELISFQLYLKYATQSEVNPLMVIRKLFTSGRQLSKASDLYPLYLYDVLVELFCFSVPRYETKGLDLHINSVLKYFMGIGSVTRSVDVLLIYCNWALCCENVEKCCPVMEYLAEILTGPQGEEEMGKTETQIVVADNGINEVFNTKIVCAIAEMERASGSSIWLQIVSFKLNCLYARKCYVDKAYDHARQRYEVAWNGYEALSERVANHAMKTEFQQFYVNALFQLSNVYYKLDMPTKSFRFCEQTTVMISEILVNRIALRQEAFFQELPFRTTEMHQMHGIATKSPVSPIQMEIAMLMNDKKTTTITKSTRKKGSSSSSKEGTPAPTKSSRRLKPSSSKSTAVSTPEETHMPSSLGVVVAVDENSSMLSNNALRQPEAEKPEVKRRSPRARKIPVRSTTAKTTTATKSTSEVPVATRRKVAEKETLSTPIVSNPSVPAAVVGTRKTSRRLL